MNKILDLEPNSADAAIEIIRTDKFNTMAQELGDFIQGLSLKSEQNNTLVEKIIKQICCAEHDAFLMAFEIGLNLGSNSNG